MRALFLIVAVSFATQLPARDVPRAAGAGHASRCEQARVITTLPTSGEAIAPLLTISGSMI